VVIVPIYRKEEEKTKVLAYTDALYRELSEKHKVIFDDREQYKPGYKFAEWELQGIPLRIEIGPRDVENNKVVLVRRDTMKKDFIERTAIAAMVDETLSRMQKEMLQRARDFQKANTHKVESFDELKAIVSGDGGFVNAHWCGDAGCETKIKEATKATIRNIPFDREEEKGACVYCGKPSDGRVIFSKAY